LTSCLTGLELVVWQLTIFVFICKTDQYKPVKQEVNGTKILPALVFPAERYGRDGRSLVRRCENIYDVEANHHHQRRK